MYIHQYLDINVCLMEDFVLKKKEVMKKIVIFVLLLTMLCSLFACNEKGKTSNVGESESLTTEKVGDASESESDIDDVATVSYLPTEVRAKLEEFMANKAKGFAEFGAYYAPYASQDVFGISGVKLTSISIPVNSVGKADSDGNYLFTLFVVKNSSSGLKAAPLRTYTLKLNGEEYGFKNSAKIGKFVDVDITEHNIELADNETLAWFGAQDTVIPFGIAAGDTDVRKYITDEFPQCTGCFSKVGTSDLLMQTATILFDFKYECAEDVALREREEYARKIEELLEKYKGKYVSVIGDSISTFGGYSDNSKNNSTTGKNEVYYKTDLSKLVSWKNTYWGRLINDLEMKLCVNNSRSGSAVYGRSVNNYMDSSLYRAQELDNDAGTPNNPSDDIKPDVILYYMGINAQGESNFGDLYALLKNANETDYNSIIDNWFKAVMQNTSGATNCVPGETVKSFEQAYALTIYKMKQAYPDAEILCINLVRNKNKDERTITQYNLCIKAIAEYLGATLVDQCADSGINVNNYHSYMVDDDFLHPNAAGHYLMTRTIVDVLWEKNK